MARYGSKRGSKRTYKRGSKKTYKKKAPTTVALSKRIKHIENDLIELKWKDDVWALTNLTPAGNLLSAYQYLVQGPGQSNRVGNKVSPTSLQFKMQIESSVVSTSPVLVRVFAFWDRQVNGSSPTFMGYNNGIFDDTTVTNPCFAPRNYGTIHRYTMLYDQVFTLTPRNWYSSTTSGGTTTVATLMPTLKYLNKRFKLSRVIKYDTNTGTIADLVSNAFYVGILTDESDVIKQPSMSGAARMYYKDA